MCGIVSFFGQFDGITHVLEALQLLEYRAPDSSGLAVIAENGHFNVRRSVGAPKHLIAKMAAKPLYTTTQRDDQKIAAFLIRQGLGLDPDSLRNCSTYLFEQLYTSSGLSVGIGDCGAPAGVKPVEDECCFSEPMIQILKEVKALTSPEYDRDPVRHAFRLAAIHVTGRLELDDTLRQTLDRALLSRVPDRAYANWQEAWADEVALNVPGQAFAVAVRHFQETFPGLAEHLQEKDWERIGGLTAQAMAQVVIGHGRWAMVGAVTESNAHPFLDRSGRRVVCENGSHNASLLLSTRAEQEAWWQARGLPANEPVHRSENTTEVIVYEWERLCHQIAEGNLPESTTQLLAHLNEWQIEEPEEQALRLTLRRLQTGTAHACTFYSRQNPGTLYVSSHNKPIALAIRTVKTENGSLRQELMVASDVNAALMLWPGCEVEAAATRLQTLRQAKADGQIGREEAQQEIQAILDNFVLDVIFLDADLYQGQELLACICHQIEEGQVAPHIRVTRYDGAPVAVTPRRVQLNPAMVGKQGYPSYIEYHIAEIPDVIDDLIKTYLDAGEVKLDSLWQEGWLFQPGLNTGKLRQKFGDHLEQLKRLLLIGEGSSWRDAQAAALLFRKLLPGVLVNVYRPVEVLNLGQTIDVAGDLAIEISWSGTTDSLLKVDSWLAEMGVMRLAVTGRPQSDLGRRTTESAGTLDVRTGVEVSVATVKGYEALLMTLDLCAIQFAHIQAGAYKTAALAQLLNELSLVIPQHIRTVIEDQNRRARLRRVAERCRYFNKVAVVGNSPADIEAELKIEELAQIVANTFDFSTASLRSLIERSAMVDHDRHRTLFVVNATNPAAHQAARPIIRYLHELGLFCLVHTTRHEEIDAWEDMSEVEVFETPAVSLELQPLIDAPFFFDLAVALAYARGLSAEEIDRPRNLAKSVTTTGAERRVDVEARREFHNVTLTEFTAGRLAQTAWDRTRAGPSRSALRATMALRSAMSVISEPLPAQLALNHPEHLVIITDTESTENGASMAAVAWQELIGIDMTVYRRFISQIPEVTPGTALLQLIRSGSVLAVQDAHTVALPSDMTPWQLEVLGAVYLIGLAMRLARQYGADTALWEMGLAQLPLIIANVLSDKNLAQATTAAILPFISAGYDKAQVIGGGQDFSAALSIARSLRRRGLMAEALYTDSAWHGPLATVGGADAEHDTMVIILATDPLFQAAALVDTQVYRTRNASVLLVVPEGNQDLPVVRGVDPYAVLAVPAVPRPFLPVINAAFGLVLNRQIARLWKTD